MKFFFDVDGVLIQGFSSNPNLHKPWNKTIDQDLGIDQEQMAKLFFAKRFDQVVLGKVELHEALSDFLSEIGKDITADAVVSYWLEKDSNLNLGVWDWIKEREIPQSDLFIATNQEKNRADYLWHKMRFKERFTRMFYSGSIGYSKSNPAFFKSVMQETSFSPSQCVIMDDSPHVIACASSCGWNAILYEDQHSLQQLENYL